MTSNDLSPHERRDWLRLARSQNVSPIGFALLLRRYGSAAVALEALPGLAERGGKRNLIVPSQGQIEDEIARTEIMGGRIIGRLEEAYPPALAAIEDAPPMISVLGDAKQLQRPTLALIGAREASLLSRKMTEAFARELGRSDIQIASGLARGIDAAAHRGSIETGTTALLAGGVDVIYPEENRTLYQEIMDKGVLVSDQPLGSEPYVAIFPRRHRLITGVSLALLVIEAGRQSTCIVAASGAREQSREVFAVPGSPLDPNWSGTHHLLRKGARAVENTSQIRAFFAECTYPVRARELAAETMTEDSDPDLHVGRVIIHEYLTETPVSIEELSFRLALPRPVLATVLLELELAGRIERLTGSRVRLPGDEIDAVDHRRLAI